jgi:hypothetical protein
MARMKRNQGNRNDQSPECGKTNGGNRWQGFDKSIRVAQGTNVFPVEHDKKLHELGKVKAAAMVFVNLLYTARVRVAGMAGRGGATTRMGNAARSSEGDDEAPCPVQNP